MPRHKVFDLEEMVLFLSLYAAAGAGLWFRFRLPLPDCPFRALTGYPCLTCNITRALQSFYEGDFASALFMNPLFSVFLTALLLFNVYSAAVICLGKKRVRVNGMSAGEAALIRVIAAGLIIFNWGYLIASADGNGTLLSALLLP